MVIPEKIPALTAYQQALNAYNPNVYSAHKKITAEEWNALMLSLFAQGNRQEHYIQQIINGHLTELVETINDIIDSITTLEGDMLGAITLAINAHNTGDTDPHKNVLNPIRNRLTATEGVANSAKTLAESNEGRIDDLETLGEIHNDAIVALQLVDAGLRTDIDATTIIANAAKDFALDSYKSVTYNGTTGELTFTRNDATETKVDLPLENIIASGYYDVATKELVLVMVSGDEIRIPAEDLVDDYFGSTSANIDINISSENIISAVLKSGTITEAQLATVLATKLNAKANTADLSAVAFSGLYGDIIGTPSIPTRTSELTNNSDFTTNTKVNTEVSRIDGELAYKQPTLVNQVNIKSINNNSLLGSGNIDLAGTMAPLVNNLTDGGATSALTAEMGKELDINKADLDYVNTQDTTQLALAKAYSDSLMDSPNFTGALRREGYIGGTYQMTAKTISIYYSKVMTLSSNANSRFSIDLGINIVADTMSVPLTSKLTLNFQRYTGSHNMEYVAEASSVRQELGTFFIAAYNTGSIDIYYKSTSYVEATVTILGSTGDYTVTAPSFVAGSNVNPPNPLNAYQYTIAYTDYKRNITADSPAFTGSPTAPTPTIPTGIANKAYVDSRFIRQPNKTYVLYHATAGANNLYLSAATYAHTYTVAGAYLITISGTGSSATVDWGDGTSDTVAFTGGFKINNQTDKDKYIEVYLGTNYVIIGERAFFGCTKLTSITIPDSVTSIGDYAFSGCSKLTSITIPNNATNIGTQAFYGCTKLTSITIPNNVASIGNNAFGYCRGLTSITIPNSVTSISNNAFQNCLGLTSVNFMGSTLPTISAGAFEDCRIADIIATSSANADSAATAITTAGGTLLTNYRKLY